MEANVYNPQKGRLETINVEITTKNTTWFDDFEGNDSVRMITDIDGCLLIREFGYQYPILIYDISRRDIDFDRHKAFLLKNSYR